MGTESPVAHWDRTGTLLTEDVSGRTIESLLTEDRLLFGGESHARATVVRAAVAQYPVTPRAVCGLLVSLHVYEATRHDAVMREAHRRAWQEPKLLDLYDTQATPLDLTQDHGA